MKSWKLILVLGAIAFGAAPVLDTLLWADAAASGSDRDPPVVQVQPSETPDAGATLTVSARIVDPSGIGPVVLWVRGENDDEFKPVAMEQVGGDQVQVELAPWPGQGSYVSYYIEAKDGEGNGPGYAGAPRTPYVIRFKGGVSTPAETKTNWVLWGATAGAVIVLLGGYFLYRRAARKRLETGLIAELDRLTGCADESASAMKAIAPAPVQRKPEMQVPENPAEQAFWIGLLAPLGEMGGRDREFALQNLAVRAHHHPVLGKRFFDLGTLSRHLQWVERGEIEVTAEMIDDDRPRSHKLDR